MGFFANVSIFVGLCHIDSRFQMLSKKYVNSRQLPETSLKPALAGVQVLPAAPGDSQQDLPSWCSTKNNGAVHCSVVTALPARSEGTVVPEPAGWLRSPRPTGDPAQPVPSEGQEA